MRKNIFRRAYGLTLLCLCTLVAQAQISSGQVLRIGLSSGAHVLTVENSSLSAGAKVMTWSETNVPAQRWTAEVNDKGGFTLVNAYTGYCLSAASSTLTGTLVVQTKKSATTTYSNWTFEPVEGSEDTYVIYLGNSRTVCLGAAVDQKDGVQLTLVNVARAGNDRTHWHVTVDADMPTSFTPEVRDEMMQHWKNKYYKKANVGHVIGNGGWWGDAEMFEVVLDAYETTGDAQYATMFAELYKNFCSRNGTDWSGNNFNDDIAWMCIACVRAYLLTGITEYRTRAKLNFDKMYKRANAYGDNTLIWCMGKTGTNSCINGPAAVAACYLGQALGDESYYEKARLTYQGERNILYNINNKGEFNGQVYDSYDTENKKVGNTWSSTYNQGTSLGAACMLYEHFGNEMYRKDANAIMTWTANNLANGDGIIKVCQTSTGDLTGFKGILMRYVRGYAALMGKPEWYDWLAKNAYHAYNNRNAKGISMSAWLTKTPDNFNYSDGGDFSNDGVGAMTALSAAFNAHLGVVRGVRDARATHACCQFDTQRGADLVISGTVEQGQTVVGPLYSGACLSYKRVDFGQNAPSHLLLRANIMRATARLAVYADSLTGTPLCTLSATGDSLGAWMDYRVRLDTALTGTHTILFRLTGTNGVRLAWMNNFSFDYANHIYPNLTVLPEATLTAAPEADGLAALTDGLSSTGCTLPAPEGTALTFHTATPITVMGYALLSAPKAGLDPMACQLQASDDGLEWHDVDSRRTLAFDGRGERLLFNLPAPVGHAYWRLLLEPAGETNAVALSEVQLLGSYCNPLDVTADGGLMNEGAQPVMDKDLATTLQTNEDLHAFTYEAQAGYLVSAYSITAGTDAAAMPSRWTLYGSANGVKWTALDIREWEGFPYPQSTNVYRLAAPAGYRFFKLEVEPTEAGVWPEVAEWQLYGLVDYGTFYPDFGEWSNLTTADGTAAPELADNLGTTCSTVAGTELAWRLHTPVPMRVVSCSLVSGFDRAAMPSAIALSAQTDGEEQSLTKRNVSFDGLGSRVTFSVASTVVASDFKLEVTEMEASVGQAQLAEWEVYGTAIVTDPEMHPEASRVTASHEGTQSSTGVEKLTDAIRTTSYRTSFVEPVSVTFAYDTPVAINAYGITSSRTDENCDPTAWTVEAQADENGEWTLLHQVEDNLFPVRYATNLFRFNAESQAYRSYRFTFTGVNGGDELQIAELQPLRLDAGSGDGVATVVAPGDMAGMTVRDGALHVQALQDVTVRIYSAQGVLSQVSTAAAGGSVVSLDSLPAGSYVAAFAVGGRLYAVKFSK